MHLLQKMKAKGTLKEYRVIGRKMPTESEPVTPLYRCTISAKSSKLVFTVPLQDEDLCHWPDCGKIQVTKVQHRVDLYAPVPGFGTFWDSWGSSRRPLERLSLLRRSGRRSLSRSRTLVSGWGDCFKCYMTPITYYTYFRYDSRSGTHNMYREYRDLTVNSAITQVQTCRE